MRMTAQEYNDLFPDANKPQDSDSKEREKYRYIEDDIQEKFVATIHDLRDKGLFKQIPSFQKLIINGMPIFGSDKKSKEERIKRGMKNKRKGYRAGWPDLQIVWKLEGKNPRFAFLEVKAPGQGLNENQRELHAEFLEMGVAVRIMRSQEDGLKALKAWGILPSCFNV